MVVNTGAVWLLIQGLCGCYYRGFVVVTTGALWLLLQGLCGCFCLNVYMVGTTWVVWLLQGLSDYLDSVQSVFHSILAFQPTGWTHSKTTSRLENIKPKIRRSDLTVYGE